ncbi:unnamed protein product (macronuclear) [Paramecium tetraurelia]|uniref:Uncharacterized protein n=1 Tax=Paramecium tetraurelia TaxID=5888 RepID=A0CBI2_PARTE|nr:uncharacterized protein GSPATT00036932001 [Paramecium tetraurelia]CAK68149.1 unnamed protein product [Paramecium tetraurelia]|eukprot:XP_001435546.1 hypothetical protein (macronuclear) [Paramecium tetraurelia strain d4-2]
MNYSDWFQKLNKDDKDQDGITNELSQMNIYDLIKGIQILYLEIKRLNRLQEIQGSAFYYKERYETTLKSNQDLSNSNKELSNSNQELQKGKQDLEKQNIELYKFNQELFGKNQKLLSNYEEVVNHFQNIITQYKKSTIDEFARTIKSEEEILGKFQTIQNQLEHQVEIKEINKTQEEIQQKSQEIVYQMKNFQKDYNQNLIRDQISSAQSVSNQTIIDKIKQIVDQIKLVLSISDTLLNKLSLIVKSAKNQTLIQQISLVQNFLQHNNVIYTKCIAILNTFACAIEKHEKKIQYYKEQLQNEQKYRVECQGQMEQQKKNYEMIMQSRRQNQQLNQPENQNRFIKQYFQIYQEYFTLILNLIEIQNFQFPKIELEITNWKQELRKEFTDLKLLIEFAQKQYQSLMKLANYITQENKLKEILYSQNNFFIAYSKILKELSQS